MDPSFEPYFRERVRSITHRGYAWREDERLRLGAPGPLGGYETDVSRAIEQGIEPYRDEKYDVIRPDAELMLHLAFMELVGRPIIAVHRNDTPINDVLEAIKVDVGKIIEEALARRQSGERISAHDIINSASRLWPEMRTAGFQLWD